MGQSALILTLAATLTIIVILIVVGQTTRDTDEELAQYHYKVLAREVASTGLNMTVRRMVAEPYRWSDPTYVIGYDSATAQGAGTFTSIAVPSGALYESFYGWDQDTITVVSTGRVSTTGGDTTHVIEARYVKGYKDFGLPPAFKKAVFADSMLKMNGTNDIRHSDPLQDAHIHGNDELYASGTNDVIGFGTVSDDPMHEGEMGHIRPNAETMFQPVDPEFEDGDPLVWADDPIFLPAIVASEIDNGYHVPSYEGHVHIADSLMTQNGGNPAFYDLTGTISPSDYACWPTCGTAENPLLYYVPGDLNINNIIVKGYVQFVVAGSIDINGSAYGFVDVDGDTIADEDPGEGNPGYDEWIDAQLEAGDFTKIGYYAEGEIDIHGNTTLVGQLYANGDINLGGQAGQPVNIFGGVTSSDGNVTLKGGVSIRFAMLSKTTLLPGLHYIVPEGVRLIAYAEW